MNIYDELTTALKITPRDGEERQAFLRRLWGKANDLNDTAWDKLRLSEPAQKWVNNAAGAVEEKTDLPDLPASSNGSGEPTIKAKGKKGSKKAEPPAKATKAKKAKVAKAVEKDGKPKANGGKGRKGSFDLNAKITLKKDENPHRAGSNDYDKYKKLSTGMKVDQALDKGVDWGYLRYGEAKGLFAIR